jgi:hypothetical protein
MVDRCSIRHEYIMDAESPYPGEVKQLNALPSAKKIWLSQTKYVKLRTKIPTE